MSEVPRAPEAVRARRVRRGENPYEHVPEMVFRADDPKAEALVRALARGYGRALVEPTSAEDSGGNAASSEG